MKGKFSLVEICYKTFKIWSFVSLKMILCQYPLIFTKSNSWISVAKEQVGATECNILYLIYNDNGQYLLYLLTCHSVIRCKNRYLTPKQMSVSAQLSSVPLPVIDFAQLIVRVMSRSVYSLKERLWDTANPTDLIDSDLGDQFRMAAVMFLSSWWYVKQQYSPLYSPEIKSYGSPTIVYSLYIKYLLLKWAKPENISSSEWSSPGCMPIGYGSIYKH